MVFFTQKIRGSWHRCEVNFVVSSITMYNMWCLLWHILFKDGNLTLGNGTNYIEKDLKKKYSGFLLDIDHLSCAVDWSMMHAVLHGCAISRMSWMALMELWWHMGKLGLEKLTLSLQNIPLHMASSQLLQVSNFRISPAWLIIIIIWQFLIYAQSSTCPPPV